MNKITHYFGLLLAIVLLGTGCDFTSPSALPSNTVASDAKNATYTIEGKQISLQNGFFEQALTPGSSTTMRVQLFGEPVYGDITGDSATDTAAVLTVSSGGSGTFFYVVAAIRGAYGFDGTNAVLLGDRIAPQNIEIKNGIVIANYADRKPGEPMSASPSVGVSKYLKYEKGALVESNTKDDLILLETPTPGSTITSPVTITGRARGNWFFEASFPVVLVDWHGEILAQGIATAKSNWMTNAYVPFEAKLRFTVPTSTPSTQGALILKKDNPSGDPAKDNALLVQVDLGK